MGIHQWMLELEGREPQDNGPESDDYVDSTMIYVDSPVDAELGSRELQDNEPESDDYVDSPVDAELGVVPPKIMNLNQMIMWIHQWMLELGSREPQDNET
ncbi:hypothetical protein OS493_040457 [Desmophyllum pertusum]|uniref:Uncharacterized protein n=1 Tax=Desmophyllum pertusum TaxID=174260 RepID=A0A9W9ZHC4_9CNID|nr:hypothetical protein OS493_040457 [Desmophyllum pertusum]